MERRIPLAALAVVYLLGTGCNDDDNDFLPPEEETEFMASLTGNAERPDPVTTTATGTASISIDESAQTIDFTITVANMTDITDAHIHIGGVNEAGPPVVDLLVIALVPGPVNGELSAGVVAATDIFGGETFATLIEKIRDGMAYINVHTITNTSGEIRGQLVPD